MDLLYRNFMFRVIRNIKQVIKNVINVQVTMKKENTDFKKKQVKVLEVITISLILMG